VSLTFLSLLNRLGSVSTFLLYAVLSLAGLWFCFRFVPETKGVRWSGSKEICAQDVRCVNLEKLCRS
jgi:hypothetical protein